MIRLLLLLLLSFGLQAQSLAPSQAQTAELKALVAAATRLPLERSDIKVTPFDSPATRRRLAQDRPPSDGWAMAMVSWVAMDRAGVIYLLQRGDKADPVVAIDRTGRVLRSWGRGLYVMPHAIRVDPQGNVWTTDAASSMVIKFTPEGKQLMEIAVGGQPTPCRNNFCGTTDVAFGPNGRLFISDGYANARILEYTADGRKVREWGTAGTGPAQFQLPHSIVVDEGGIVYVADRENGRVQRFDLEGKFLGQWPDFGKTFSLALSPGAVWLATQPRTDPNLSPGWLMKVDRKTGKLLGHVDATGVHGMDARDDGTVLFGPGPTQTPQIYRRP